MKLIKGFIKILKLTQSHTRKLHRRGSMACSRYEYVKKYERDDSILPNVWIVIRVDGKGFHKFSQVHDFEKPNDENALNLMSTAAVAVMEEFRDVILAYGQSDEYSFIFRKEANVFNRRQGKLLSYVTSLFSSAYVMHWPKLFPQRSLKYPPSFDGRIVLYPSDQNLRDYLSWRQADVHINNLYNTAFWSLVLQGGLNNQEAEAELRGTFSADKNELLFSRFGINYNNEPVMYRKGTILMRKRVVLVSQDTSNDCKRQLIVPFHEDIIRDDFWQKHPELLDNKCTLGEFKAVDANVSGFLLAQLEKVKIFDLQEKQQKSDKNKLHLL